jgi:hypothetical protein
VCQNKSSIEARVALPATSCENSDAGFNLENSVLIGARGGKVQPLRPEVRCQRLRMSACEQLMGDKWFSPKYSTHSFHGDMVRDSGLLVRITGFLKVHFAHR